MPAIAGELAQMCLAFPPGVFDMRAGESARNVAQRQRMEAERLQRSAELWERGAEGEAVVARALEALPEEWVVLHDLAWPGRQRANLDHVVIGPGGVFVVDAKNWTGHIEVRDQVLVQNGRQRESAVSSVTAAAIAVQEIVSPVPCTGVLCFVRDEPLVTASWNVTVCSTTTLVATLTSRPPALSPDDVRRCAEAVRVGTATRSVPHAATRRSGDKGRPSKKRGRPVLALVGMLVFLATLVTGGYQVAAEWAGTRLAEVIVPDVPSEPAPTKPAKQKRPQQDKKAKLQNQRG
jgi:hypothetical protein